MKALIFMYIIFGYIVLFAQTESEFSRGIIEVGVVVSDLEKSVDFYEKIIGMKKVGGFDINKDFGKRSGLTGGEPFSVASPAYSGSWQPAYPDG